MESTCRTTCKFWRKYKTSCPFYVETTWTPQDESKPPEIITDCSPKRSLYLQLEFHSKIDALMKASNQERNVNHLVLAGIHEAIERRAHPLVNITDVPFETNGYTRRAKLLEQGDNENTDRQISGEST